jgi:periplasmic divalent cation tolerance protein
MSEYIVILVTASTEQEAETIAEDLVASRLAACGNIVPGIRSIFQWKDEVQKEEETLLILKSRSELFGRIEKRVRELHSYEVPEIVALPILEGSQPYLAWLSEETGNKE